MVTPKKIIVKDLELADEEIARLRKENKELKANYNKALSDVVMLTKENKELKNKLEEADKYVVLQKIRSGDF